MQVSDEMVRVACDAYNEKCDGAYYGAAVNPMRAALTAALNAMWRPVGDSLPALDEIVLVVHKSGYDGAPIYAYGARLSGDEGWVWGIGSGVNGIRPDKDVSWNDIQCDDEYDITHWQPLLSPPAGEK